MKTVLAATFLALVAMSVAVKATRPSDAEPGRTSLIWVTDQNPTRDDQIGYFEKVHETLAIKIDPGNTDTQKVIVQSQAGVGPDMFDYWGQAAKDAYVKSGIAYDLGPELRKRGIDYHDRVWPLALPWTTTGEHVYGIPANVGVDALWVHRDMFERAGVPIPKAPWTFDELVQTAKKLTVRDSQGRITQYGLLIDFGGCYREFLATFGGDFFSEDGTRCTLDQPESVACLEYVHDLLYRHKVAPTPSDEQSMTAGGGWGGGAGPQSYFRKRMGAMALGGRWWLVQLRLDIRDRGFKLASVEPPVGKTDRLSGGGTRAVMINSKGKNRDQAVEFALYLLGEDYNFLLNDQGDALSGVRDFAYTDRYLRPPDHPDEDFHEAFRASLERGVMSRNSPFISVNEFDTILNPQLDLVKLNQKPAGLALRDAARKIEATMKRNIERDPELKQFYLAAGGAR